MPKGSIGELCIAGVGLADGYYQRDELTAAQFLMTDAGFVYRTGDLAQLNQNGTITYKGRIDDQVKLRGHRIELGEIANHIKEIDHIENAVVIARNNVLIAYVVDTEKGQSAALSSLKEVYNNPYWIHLSDNQARLTHKQDLSNVSYIVTGGLIASDSVRHLYDEDRMILLNNTIDGVFRATHHKLSETDLDWPYLPLGAFESFNTSNATSDFQATQNIKRLPIENSVHEYVLVTGSNHRPVLSQPFLNTYLNSILDETQSILLERDDVTDAWLVEIKKIRPLHAFPLNEVISLSTSSITFCLINWADNHYRNRFILLIQRISNITEMILLHLLKKSWQIARLVNWKPS